MHSLTCPHCQSTGHFKSRVPRDVIAVLPCPACHELVVLFRSQTIALDRRVLESGTLTERKEHLAQVIGEFLEVAGGLPLRPGDISGISTHFGGRNQEEAGADCVEDGQEEVISEQELEKFVRVDLKCLDNGAYFRRHFG